MIAKRHFQHKLRTVLSLAVIQLILAGCGAAVENKSTDAPNTGASVKSQAELLALLDAEVTRNADAKRAAAIAYDEQNAAEPEVVEVVEPEPEVVVVPTPVVPVPAPAPAPAPVTPEPEQKEPEVVEAVEPEPEVVVVPTPVVPAPAPAPVTPEPEQKEPEVVEIVEPEPEVVVVPTPVVPAPAPVTPEPEQKEPEVVEVVEQEPVQEEPEVVEVVEQEPVQEEPEVVEVVEQEPVQEEPEVVEVVEPEEPTIIEIIGEPDVEPTPELNVQFGSVRLGWNRDFTFDNGNTLAANAIDGFEIVYGNSPDQMNSSISISNISSTEYEITNLEAGEYYFAIRVIPTSGDPSPFSERVFAAIL